MRLYYMTSLDVAIDHILPEKRLRIARFDSLNDPFELHGVDMGSDGAHVKKTLIEHWTPTIGVLCFGLHWKSPVMWAHYARSHTGVCLGFDVPDDKPQQMQYSKTPYQWRVDPKKFAAGVTEDVIQQMMSIKYEQWAYEEEWRLFTSLDTEDNGYYFFNFHDNLELKEVILGSRCKASFETIRKAAGYVQSDVTIRRAAPHFDSFTMIEDMTQHPMTLVRYPSITL